MDSCSIVVIANKKKQYKMFVESLKKQKNIEYQLITIENYNCEYSGARQAYNSIINSIKYDTVIFCHPDICFLDENVLSSIVSRSIDLGNYGIIGVAGCREGEKWEILSTMHHGSECVLCGTLIEKEEVVQSVDECLFIMRKSFINQMRFTDLPGWHLYAVEQCIRADKMGYKNYVIPSNVYHFSKGNSLDPKYVLSLLEVRKIYEVSGRILNTTVKQWDFRTKRGILYIYYYYIKQKIKRVLVKFNIIK